jgi:hypothetical protein
VKALFLGHLYIHLLELRHLWECIHWSCSHTKLPVLGVCVPECLLILFGIFLYSFLLFQPLRVSRDKVY